MTSQNQAILDGLSAAVTAALQKKIAEQSNYDKVLADVRELQRQAEYHRSRYDNTNLQIVNVQLNARYKDLDAAQNKLNDATTAYNSALKAYEDAAARILTPEEKKAELAKTQAVLQQQTIAAEAAKNTTAANYASSRAKYILIAGVVIVIIAGVVYYFWFRKKGA